MGGNLNIYINGIKIEEKKITTWCSDWTDMLWEITLDLTMTWEDANKLYDNIMPGYHTEWSLGLGQKIFVDTTYSNENTLLIEPIGKLSSKFDEVKIVIKYYEDTPLNKDYVAVRLNGYILVD